MRNLILSVLLLLQTSGTPLTRWGNAVKVGSLDVAINEASGLAVSARYSNRLYHINASGDTGRFFVTDQSGAKAQSVTVSGFDPIDVEDLSIGPCGRTSDCLFLPDIGDNRQNRLEVEVVEGRQVRDGREVR